MHSMQGIKTDSRLETMQYTDQQHLKIFIIGKVQNGKKTGAITKKKALENQTPVKQEKKKIAL